MEGRRGEGRGGMGGGVGGGHDKGWICMRTWSAYFKLVHETETGAHMSQWSSAVDLPLTQWSSAVDSPLERKWCPSKTIVVARLHLRESVNHNDVPVMRILSLSSDRLTGQNRDWAKPSFHITTEV